MCWKANEKGGAVFCAGVSWTKNGGHQKLGEGCKKRTTEETPAETY